MFFDITLPAMRRRTGKAFRKSLGVFNYKIGAKDYHKKPGVIPLNVKERLTKDGRGRSMALIKQLERESPYPFGALNRKGKFILDPKRVPFYDIPNLTDFNLKPYVSVHTPKIDDETRINVRALNDFLNPANFGRFDAAALPEATSTPSAVEKAQK